MSQSLKFVGWLCCPISLGQAGLYKTTSTAFSSITWSDLKASITQPYQAQPVGICWPRRCHPVQNVEVNETVPPVGIFVR